MNIGRPTLKHVFLTAGVLLLASLAACGKSGDEKNAASGGDAGDSAPPVTVAQDAPMKADLERAGFKPIWFRDFPSQVPGFKANMVVYRADNGGTGGVIYAQEHGNTFRPVWHWYFSENLPDSVQAVEVNEDGLWDIRMFAGASTYDYVQDQSFTFLARQRADAVAMNGATSEPVDADGMAWRAFDGDSTTAWRSRTNDAYFDLPVPLGLQSGILTIQLLTDDQPREVELKADGRTVQTLELDETTAAQSIQLEPAAKEASVLRLEFKSTYRGASDVAVAELGLR